jgi:Ni/Co efflux regulator RcnB
MKPTLKTLATAVLCAVVGTSASIAQDHHDDRAAEHHDDHGGGYVRHDDWKKGHRLPPNDWARGQRIDYHAYHLNAPPRGYEWRAVDGNYVLAAVATGLVSSVIIASTVH